MANKYKETNWKLKKILLKEMKTKYCLFIDGSIENLNGKQLAGFASFIYNRMVRIGAIRISSWSGVLH